MFERNESNVTKSISMIKNNEIVIFFTFILGESEKLLYLIAEFPRLNKAKISVKK